MSWSNQQAVAQLIQSLTAMGAPVGRWGKRGGRPPPQAPKEGSKQWAAATRTGWSCPSCSFYNFGYRKVCFACKHTPTFSYAKGGGKGKGAPLPTKLTQPWLNLQSQVDTEKDPDVKAALQKVVDLKKSKEAGGPVAPPAKVQREQLVAKAKRLSAAVDKQQDILDKAMAKLQELRKDLATVYVDISHLPEEQLPMPKKVARQCFGPATIELMQFVRAKAQEGDEVATSLLQNCVEEWEDSLPPLSEGDEMEADEGDFLDEPPPKQARTLEDQNTPEGVEGGEPTREEEISAVVSALEEGGAPWEAIPKRRGRPPKPSGMKPGALDPFLKRKDVGPGLAPP